MSRRRVVDGEFEAEVHQGHGGGGEGVEQERCFRCGGALARCVRRGCCVPRGRVAAAKERTVGFGCVVLGESVGDVGVWFRDAVGVDGVQDECGEC